MKTNTTAKSGFKQNCKEKAIKELKVVESLSIEEMQSDRGGKGKNSHALGCSLLCTSFCVGAAKAKR